jgi:hypothetical protein
MSNDFSNTVELVSDRKPRFYERAATNYCVVMTFIIPPTSLQPASVDYGER